MLAVSTYDADIGTIVLDNPSKRNVLNEALLATRETNAIIKGSLHGDAF